MCHSVHSTYTVAGWSSAPGLCVYICVCVCVWCTIASMYRAAFIFGRRAERVRRWRSRVHPFVHAHVCVHVRVYVCAFVNVQRGSVVPAVLLFGTARRVNPGQCGKKAIRSASSPHELRPRDEARRNARKRGREERRVEGEEGDAMCTACRTRSHACMHAYTPGTHSRCGRPSNVAFVAKPGCAYSTCLARMRASFTCNVKF